MPCCVACAQVYPPPHMCPVCNESFVLEVELVRHRKFGCATERLKEQLLAEQDREQRRLQVGPLSGFSVMGFLLHCAGRG